MGNLIPFAQRFIAGISTRTVSARKLHEFLEVKRDFSNWIKGRIEQYDFEENKDFISIRQNGRKPKGGRPTADYYLTIDMAKELAMVERNEKGKQARRYFIDCEKKLTETKQLTKSIRQRFLLTIDSDGTTSSMPVPDNAYIIPPANLKQAIAMELPDYTLVKRKDLIAIHRSFSNLQAAIKGSAEAWNSIADNTGMDALNI